jgi:cation diffusion facilitator family transporter
MTKTSRKHILTAIYIGLSINIFLTIIKLGFGLWGNSQALVSDGVNSLSDVFMSTIIFFILKISTKSPDKDHPYGHQKFEGLAYYTIGLVFAATAIYLAYGSISSVILFTKDPSTHIVPNIWTLIISAFALIIKMGLAYYYFRLKSTYENPTLKSEFKNHFYDIFSTGLTVIVLLLSQFNLIIFDYIGSLIISFFILRLSIQIIKEATSFLVDESPEPDKLNDIQSFIESIKGVKSIDDLRVRRHMTEWYVDVEIGVDDGLSLKNAHDIAEDVHLSVEEKFKEVIHCMVHVNPKSR